MLPKHLFCTNDAEAPGAGLIQCTDWPYLYGKILKFDKPEKYKAWIDKHKDKTHYVTVPGYYIIIHYLTQLIPGEANTADVLTGMREFFITQKLQKNAGSFKRYSF